MASSDIDGKANQKKGEEDHVPISRFIWEDNDRIVLSSYTLTLDNNDDERDHR